jgi:hypothetical protein
VVVSDIEAAHEELVGRGIDATDVWHGPPFPAEARQPGPDPSAPATDRSSPSMIPITTHGLSRRSPRGSPAGSTPLARRSHSRRTWRVRFGVPRPPTASLSGAPGCETRTGPTGMPSTPRRNRPGQICRPDRFRRGYDGQRRASFHSEQPSTLAADETESPGCRFAKAKRQPLRLELRDRSRVWLSHKAVGENVRERLRFGRVRSLCCAQPSRTRNARSTRCQIRDPGPISA